LINIRRSREKNENYKKLAEILWCNPPAGCYIHRIHAIIMLTLGFPGLQYESNIKEIRQKGAEKKSEITWPTRSCLVVTKHSSPAGSPHPPAQLEAAG
jgi:hypothetical protein